ncbi:TIR domain-containing protein [Mesorhizobium sp. VK4C]|uniref:TIR domain-containing protein n=1 Tax=Mesorhizobium captivum TaxID=3072319 RepID=UPI002A23F528|nr:TIR domain-containing protein [Mesorhizobium sp. VK4C]MDX8501920.1 TIR domain-containing protein [Mesorhizobium sp. VK4C]
MPGFLRRVRLWFAARARRRHMRLPPSGTYFAFISYRQAAPDKVEAAWLQTALETYDIPSRLAARLKRKPRLGKIFRDSEELAATPDLWGHIVEALERSEHLIVLCSPRSVQRKWVNDEIAEFIRLGRQDKIYAVLVEGEPADVFPPALLGISRIASQDVGLAIDRPDEPLAADLRPDPVIRRGAQRRTALLRLVAGMLDIGFDDLRNRDQERRARRLVLLAIGAMVALALVSGLGIWAEFNREAAVRERTAAVASQALSLARLGDDAWGQHRALDAEADFASSLAVKDDPAIREKILQVRARGIRQLWGAANRIGGGALVLSQDGSEVIAAHEDQVIRVWSVADGSSRPMQVRHPAAIVSLVLSPDGKRLASGGKNGDVLVFNLADGALLERYAPTMASVIALGFDSVGDVWSLSEDNVLTRRKTDGTWVKVTIPGAKVGAAIIRANGIIAGDNKGFVRVIDPATGADISAFKADPLAIGALAVDSSGKRLAEWGTSDRYVGKPVPCMCVRIWSLQDPATPQELADSPGYPSANGLAFSSDGIAVAIATLSGLEVWNTTTGQLQKTGNSTTSDSKRAPVFSLDGKQVFAIGGYLGRYSVAPMAPVDWLKGHAGAIEGLAFSPDGKTLVSVGLEGGIRFHDPTTGSEHRVLDGDPKGLLRIGFDATGRYLLGCTTGGAAKLWDIEAPDGVAPWAISTGRSFVKQCASFEPVTGRLAVLRGNDVGFVSAAGELENATAIKDINPSGLVYSPDGSKLAVVDTSNQITFYTMTYYGQPEPVPLAPGFDRTPILAFSPSGRLFAAAGNQLLLVWRADSPGQPVHEINLPSEANDIAFSPDGQLIAAAMYGEVAIIDAIAGTIIARFNPYQVYQSHVDRVAFDPSGTRLVVGTDQGTIHAYSIGDAAETRTIRPPDRMPGEYSFTPAIAFSPKAPIAAVSGNDRSIRLYDLTTGNVTDTIAGTFGQADGLAFSPDGRQLIAGSQTGMIRVVDLDGHAERDITVGKPDQPVHAVTPSSDPARFAFATGESSEENADTTTIVVWNTTSGKSEAVLNGHGRSVLSLAFDSTAAILASASYDTTARLWDLTHPGQYKELIGHGGSVISIAFSPNGKWVATAARDGFVRVFDVGTAKQIATLLGATGNGYVEAVSFSPTGDLLISSGQGDTILWRTGSWAPLLHLHGHDDEWVQSAAVDPTGTWLLTTSQDPYIRVWNLKALADFQKASPASILADSIARAGRQLDTDR